MGDAATRSLTTEAAKIRATAPSSIKDEPTGANEILGDAREVVRQLKAKASHMAIAYHQKVSISSLQQECNLSANEEPLSGSEEDEYQAAGNRDVVVPTSRARKQVTLSPSHEGVTHTAPRNLSRSAGNSSSEKRFGFLDIARGLARCDRQDDDDPWRVALKELEETDMTFLSGVDCDRARKELDMLRHISCRNPVRHHGVMYTPRTGNPAVGLDGYTASNSRSAENLNKAAVSLSGAEALQGESAVRRRVQRAKTFSTQHPSLQQEQEDSSNASNNSNAGNHAGNLGTNGTSSNGLVESPARRPALTKLNVPALKLDLLRNADNEAAKSSMSSIGSVEAPSISPSQASNMGQTITPRTRGGLPTVSALHNVSASSPRLRGLRGSQVTIACDTDAAAGAGHPVTARVLPSLQIPSLANPRSNPGSPRPVQSPSSDYQGCQPNAVGASSPTARIDTVLTPRSKTRLQPISTPDDMVSQHGYSMEPPVRHASVAKALTRQDAYGPGTLSPRSKTLPGAYTTSEAIKPINSPRLLVRQGAFGPEMLSSLTPRQDSKKESSSVVNKLRSMFNKSKM